MNEITQVVKRFDTPVREVTFINGDKFTRIVIKDTPIWLYDMAQVGHNESDTLERLYQEQHEE